MRGKESEVVLRDLGLVTTGERDELPAESPFAGVSLPGGWYTVVFGEYGHPLADDDVLQKLSEDCELVAAGAEEHVMVSYSEEWRDGARIWSIAHDAQEGIDHLAAEGSLPERFEAIRSERLEEQRAAGGDDAYVDHVFDVPLEVAALITGFSYDKTEPEDGFAVLVEATR